MINVKMINTKATVVLPQGAAVLTTSFIMESHFATSYQTSSIKTVHPIDSILFRYVY